MTTRALALIVVASLAVGIKLAPEFEDETMKPGSKEAQQAYMKKHEQNRSAHLEMAHQEAASVQHMQEMERTHFQDEMRPEQEFVKGTQAMAEAALAEEQASHASGFREGKLGQKQKKEHLLDAVVEGQYSARQEEERRIEGARRERELAARIADLAVVQRKTTQEIEAEQASRDAQEAAKLKALEDAKKEKVTEHKKVVAAQEKFVQKQKVEEKGNAYLASLNQRARAERMEAQKTAPEQDPMAGMMGDMSMADLMDMLTQLNEALKGGHIVDAFNAAMSQWTQSVGTLKQTVMQKLDHVVAAAGQGATPEESVKVLAGYFQEVSGLLKSHSVELNGTWNTLQNAMPVEVRTSLNNLKGLMSDPKLFDVNGSLAITPPSQACPDFAKIMTYMGECDTNMTQSKKVLNATAQMLPMLTTMLPDAGEQLMTTLTDLLDFAYVEADAMGDLAKAQTEQTAPIITGKLQCELEQSGSVRLSHSFFALVASLAVAWMYI